MSEADLQNEIEHLRHKVDVMSRLTEISTVLTSRLPLETLLETIMKVTVQITEAEAASVLLWNHKTHELFFAASTSQETHDLLGKPVPINSIAGHILSNNEIVEIEDAKNDPRHYNKVDQDLQFETRSLLGVPMIYRGKRIGVLEAINKRQLPWTPDDRHYLSVLAAQAAVVIEDAQMVMELKRVNEELSQLDKLKNDFIAIASHELRTPLGVILGYASFLQEEPSQSAQQHAGKVMQSALQLRRIIEDMINLRYLKQAQSDLKLSSFSLRELMQDLKLEMLALTEANDDIFQVIPPDEDVTVYIDRSRLTMAMTNILNNAVAFTPQGGTIKLYSEKRNNREVWIKFQDSGIGIPQEKLERIFDEFYQVEDHMTRHHGGLGIGLSITKAIVKAHRGRIWAESEGKDKGSTFTIALPLKES